MDFVLKPKTVDSKDAIELTIVQLKEMNLIPNFEENEEHIKKFVVDAIETEKKITEKIIPIENDPSVQEVENAISTIIGQDRVSIIKKAFSIETFRMKLVKDTTGEWVVQFRRGEAQFRRDIPLSTNMEIDFATIYQWASFVIEVFMFIFSCVGIVVDITTYQMRDITNEVMDIVKQPAFLKALNDFQDKWNQGGAWNRAKAIFFFLNASYALGVCWTIIKLLFKTMSIWGELRAVIECTAMLVAAFATEGLALIARITLAVDSEVTLIQKLINLENFTEFKQTQNLHATAKSPNALRNAKR